MKKEMIIVSIILIATIILNIVTQKYTAYSVKVINEQLEQIFQLTLNDFDNKSDNNKNDILSKVDKLSDEWNIMNKELAFYIEHDELEKVDTSVVTIQEDIRLGQYEEALPEIKKCEFIITHIKEKEAVKIINIF